VDEVLDSDGIILLVDRRHVISYLHAGDPE
jgi:hypothetical protein